jgi:hypothetical protein
VRITVDKVGIVLAVVVAACSPAPTPSAEPGSPGASRPSPVAGERLFGEIVAVDGSAPSITLDLGQLFGAGGPDEADSAARADGVIGLTEDLPNPFYVRDLHERRTIWLDPAATVVVLGHDAEGNSRPTPVTLAEFAVLWRTGPASGDWMPAAYYWCSLNDGRVAGIEAEHGP